MARGVYIEHFIRAPFERLWDATQNPDQHQRWDLRFSSIHHSPRPDNTKPQCFIYRTNIGFGAAIEGWGESLVTTTAGGDCVSSLRFGSNNQVSLIREGSGYWKYERSNAGVRFSTFYDYQVRFGYAGKMFDHIVFRPVMGWATAWSFDALRIWIERDISPETLLRRALLRSFLGAAALAAAATNPRSRTASVSAVAGAALFFLTARYVPSASRCKRTKEAI